MAVKIFPCKDCTDRAINCHGVCEKYQKAKCVYDEARLAERRKSDVEGYLTQRVRDRAAKCKTHCVQKNYIEY